MQRRFINFADWIVAVYQKQFGLDFQAARTLYSWTFRNYIEWVFAIILIFLIAFRIYLNRITNYFQEINNGMDLLIKESTDEIALSPEQRERYLSISLDKAERLEDLINEFFEIAKYSLSGITPSISQ